MVSTLLISDYYLWKFQHCVNLFFTYVALVYKQKSMKQTKLCQTYSKYQVSSALQSIQKESEFWNEIESRNHISIVPYFPNIVEVLHDRNVDYEWLSKGYNATI